MRNRSPGLLSPLTDKWSSFFGFFVHGNGGGALAVATVYSGVGVIQNSLDFVSIHTWAADDRALRHFPIELFRDEVLNCVAVENFFFVIIWRRCFSLV